jgi:hypothetical protein
MGFAVAEGQLRVTAYIPEKKSAREDLAENTYRAGKHHPKCSLKQFGEQICDPVNLNDKYSYLWLSAF